MVPSLFQLLRNSEILGARDLLHSESFELHGLTTHTEAASLRVESDIPPLHVHLEVCVAHSDRFCSDVELT